MHAGFGTREGRRGLGTADGRARDFFLVNYLLVLSISGDKNRFINLLKAGNSNPRKFNSNIFRVILTQDHVVFAAIFLGKHFSATAPLL